MQAAKRSRSYCASTMKGPTTIHGRRLPVWVPAIWLALATCGVRDRPREQSSAGPASAPHAASAPDTPRPAVALPSPTATSVDWPAVPGPSAGLEACPTPDVPFGQTCPRPRLDCVIGDAKRVHCQCAGTEWRCLSGAPACFEGVRVGAPCASVVGACELGNGLVFRTCACRDDHHWSCTAYGL